MGLRPDLISLILPLIFLMGLRPNLISLIPHSLISLMEHGIPGSLNQENQFRAKRDQEDQEGVNQVNQFRAKRDQEDQETRGGCWQA